MIEAGRRYHVVNCGVGLAALVEGIPDPDSPHDPNKDLRNVGAPIITGKNQAGGSFWAKLLAADVVWSDRGFKRFYEYAPSRAERIRAGTELT